MRTFTVTALAMVLASCGNVAPTSPSPTFTFVPPAGPTRPQFPPLEGSFRAFVFASELSYPVGANTRASAFRLYDNGAFVLSYNGFHTAGYRGGYVESSGSLVFDWEGWSAAAPWGASGTLRGDTLTVEFNTQMHLSDFDDAIYVLSK